MERVISPEERMRRAEEIYYRRKNQGVRVTTTSVNMGGGRKVSLGRKMFLQVLVCIVIYSTMFLIKSYNNVFSENVINQTRNILNYEINFQNLYNQFKEYFNNGFNMIIKTEKNDNQINGENINEENAKQTQTEGNNVVEEKNDSTESAENGEAVTVEQDPQNQEEVQQDTQNQEQVQQDAQNQEQVQQNNENLTQMQQDAEYIKQNYNIAKPLEGTITSGFGDREETEIISAFHQGIDISATTGTAICSAMEGTVVASSYAGDYGNHIKIQNGEVLTVYAHCSELEVNVGDYVSQGQEIGKVGATGKVTRTAFAF